MSSPDDFKTADKLLPDTTKPAGLTPYVDWRTLPDWRSDDPQCRLLVDAVPEAAKYRRDVCNQGCKTHLFFPPDGMPHEQRGGEIHECPTVTIARMWQGHYDMIRLAHIESATVAVLQDVIENQRKRNRLWAGAWNYWKKTRKVPKIKDIEEGKYLET